MAMTGRIQAPGPQVQKKETSGLGLLPPVNYEKTKLFAVKEGSPKPFFDLGGQGGRIILGNHNRKARDVTSLYNL